MELVEQRLACAFHRLRNGKSCYEAVWTQDDDRILGLAKPCMDISADITNGNNIFILLALLIRQLDRRNDLNELHTKFFSLLH